MHLFQPFSDDMLKINPFEIKTNPALLTAGDAYVANTMTISWGGAGVIWNTDVGFVFVRKSRYTKEFMDKYSTFSFSFLPPSKENSILLKYLGSVSGRDENKIEKAGLHLNYHEGTPFIDEAREVAILKKLSVTRLSPTDFIDKKTTEVFYGNRDYHYMYIGEIVKLLAR